MALADAKVGMHVSSTGGGGMLTVYDPEAPHATITGAGYWSAAQTGGPLRTRTAVEDFIRHQQGVKDDGTGGTGVIAGAIGNNGASAMLRARLLSSGRVAAWA